MYSPIFVYDWKNIAKIVLHEIKDDCDHNKSIFKYGRLSTPTKFMLTL